MDDLTPLEEKLVRCVEVGNVLDLTNDQEQGSEQEMSTWGADRSVRAGVIRDILRGRRAPAPDPHGIRLAGARIDGHLDLRHINTAIPIQLSTCYLASGADLSFAELKSVELDSCRIGRLDMQDTDVGGQLNISGSTISNDSGVALNADGLQVDGDLFLDDGFTATGVGDHGAVRLLGAHVGGQLAAFDATISNDSGPALNADGLQVDGDLFLAAGFIATGVGEDGAVRLVDARVGGVLDASGATVVNETGPALSATGLNIGGRLYLREGFTATGAGEFGAVRLARARVGDAVEFSGSSVRNDTGPALYAVGLQSATGLYLNRGFTVTGAGGHGAVDLAGARIGNQLDASNSTISNETGPALHAERVQVDGDLFLDDGFTAVSGSGYPAVVLTDARVGAFCVDLNGIKDTAGRNGDLAVDGLVYARLPVGLTVADWLVALAQRTTDYSAQPYQQLAAATRAAGHDGDTRRVLMAQRRDQIRRRAVTAMPERSWAKATGVLLGFGYQPWRALLYLLAVLAAAVALTIIVGGHHGGLAHTSRTTSPNKACSAVEQIGVGIDLGLPLIKTTARENCTTTSTTAGEVITAAGWVLQILAWALGTLFIAGFTGAVRKT